MLRSEGFSERVTYLIDRQGVIRYRSVSDLDHERDITDYMIAIEAM